MNVYGVFIYYIALQRFRSAEISNTTSQMSVPIFVFFSFLVIIEDTNRTT